LASSRMPGVGFFYKEQPCYTAQKSSTFHLALLCVLLV
jgi:hypothetical protein